jgi:hypothetical protein
MEKINRIFHVDNQVLLINAAGNIAVRLSYSEWQEYLKEYGTLTIPFVYKNDEELSYVH